MEIEIRPRSALGLRCAFCHGSAGRGDAWCRGCGTVCHPDCRALARRCPTLGCRLAPVVVRRRRLSTPFGPAASVALALAIPAILLGGLMFLEVLCTVEGNDPVRVQADMHVLTDAVNFFKLDTGRFPDALRDLWQKPAWTGARWTGPYLREVPPRDPWGNEYLYARRSGPDWELLSFGADGAPGGVESAADLSSWTVNERPQ